jgi:TonB-linked SusC/RagA family outer membrane protein
MRRMLLKSAALSTALLLTGIVCQQAYSQQKTTRTSTARVPLNEVLQQITAVHGTKFVYERTILASKGTDYNLGKIKDLPVEELLKQILYPNGLLFLYIDKNHYTIIARPEQSDKSPNSNTAALQPVGNAVNTALPVANTSMLNDVKKLDEVIVIGYGTTKKVTYTGSVATVSSKDIVKNGSPNLTDALVGRLPGITVVRPSGNDPGSSAAFNIRGMNTLNDGSHSNSPLIIIDGVQRNFAAGMSETDAFASLDPNDIENVSILKDAAAAAVYGARAANGVILITTKRGKQGKPTINYSFLLGTDKPTRMPTPLNSGDWATLYNEAQTNDARLTDGSIPASFKPLYSASDIQKFRDGSDPDHYANTNWIKEVLKPTAQQQQHNLSVSGGNNSVRYFVSLGHLNQGGFVDNYSFKRYNLRSNIDADINKTLRVSVDLAGTYSETSSPPDYSYNIFGNIMKASPVYPNRLQSDPSKFGVVVGANDRYNPYLAATQAGYNLRKNTAIFSTLSAVQQLPFVPGLSLKGLLSFNKTAGYNKSWSKKSTLFTDDGLYYKDNTFNGGYLSENIPQFQSLTSEMHLNYTRSFGKHDVSGLLLYTQTKDENRNTMASRREFLSTAVDELFAGESTGQDVDSDIAESARRGLVGRVNYAFDNKYLLEANFRYDGSSNFPPNSRWGFFPSFAAGWNISEEAFIKNNAALSFIDLLKIRASWGQLGNDRISTSFAYLDQFDMAWYKIAMGDKLVSVITPSALSNPAITWEKATTSNVGFEAQLWGGLLGIEADYFKKRTTDILAQPTLAFPFTFGASLPLLNNSIVRNEGFEIALRHQQKIGDFTYSIRPNIGYSASTIEYMPENQANINLVKSGRSQDYYGFGYQALGLFQSYEEIKNSPKQTFGNVQPGDIKYADISGPDGKPDGKIDAFDRTRIGNSSIPKITYGIAVEAGYKGFDLSVLFQGAGKASLNLSGDPGWAFASNLLVLGSAYEHHLDRWTPENPNASYPRLFLNSSNNKLTSSYWLKDASYLRLKNITLGYTLPKEILTRVGISHLRVFASATNLFTWDNLKIYDPELRSGFNTGAYYPLQKSYNLGVNVRF